MASRRWGVSDDDLLEKMREIRDRMFAHAEATFAEQRRQEIEYLERLARGEVRPPTLDEMINPPRMSIDVTATPIDDVKLIDDGEEHGTPTNAD